MLWSPVMIRNRSHPFCLVPHSNLNLYHNHLLSPYIPIISTFFQIKLPFISLSYIIPLLKQLSTPSFHCLHKPWPLYAHSRLSTMWYLPTFPLSSPATSQHMLQISHFWQSIISQNLLHFPSIHVFIHSIPLIHNHLHSASAMKILSILQIWVLILIL